MNSGEYFKCISIVQTSGQILTPPYLNGGGFTRPNFIEHKNGLGLNVLRDTFIVQGVETKLVIVTQNKLCYMYILPLMVN